MEENERMQKVTLADGYGAVNFYLLPYTNAGMLRGISDNRVRPLRLCRLYNIPYHLTLLLRQIID